MTRKFRLTGPTPEQRRKYTVQAYGEAAAGEWGYHKLQSWGRVPFLLTLRRVAPDLAAALDAGALTVGTSPAEPGITWLHWAGSAYPPGPGVQVHHRGVTLEVHGFTVDHLRAGTPPLWWCWADEPGALEQLATGVRHELLKRRPQEAGTQGWEDAGT